MINKYYFVLLNSRSNNDWRGEEKWGKGDDKKDKKPMENKAKPDFGLSGKLAEEVNTYKGKFNFMYRQFILNLYLTIDLECNCIQTIKLFKLDITV